MSKGSNNNQKKISAVKDNFRIPDEHIDLLSRAVKEVNESVVRVVAPIRTLQKALSKQMEYIANFQNELAKTLSRIDFSKIQTAANLLVDEGLKVEAMSKSGWWYCPSMYQISTDDLRSASKKYRAGNKVALTILFKKAYKENNHKLLKETVFGWEKNPHFKRRQIIVNDALEAHIAGKYTLSVPTLLPIVEGVATDFCRSNGISIRKIRSKGLVKVQKAFNHLLKESYPYKFPDLFLHILSESIYSDTRFVKGPFKRRLNRNGILHGSYTAYNNEVTSLRCFLLLDAISVLH